MLKEFKITWDDGMECTIKGHEFIQALKVNGFKKYTWKYIKFWEEVIPPDSMALDCVSCGITFYIPNSKVKWFKKKGFPMQMHCPDCLIKKKKNRSSNNYYRQNEPGRKSEKIREENSDELKRIINSMREEIHEIKEELKLKKN